MIDKIKTACSNVGVEAVILNSDRGISAQLNSLTKDMDLPIMLLSWDIESVISFDENGNLTTPVASLTVLLLKKPYELTRGEFIDCSEEMQNTFFNFLKVLRPLLIGEMRSMSDEPIFNIKTKLVPSYGTSKHSGVMASFNMLGDSVSACQINTSSSAFYDDVEKPTAPSNIQFSNVTDFQAYVTWDDATDDAMFVCHRIFLNGEFYAFAVRSQYLIEGLEPGTTYTIEIDAFDRAFNYSDEKASENFETGSESITFPTRPTDITFGPNYNSSITMSWQPSYGENNSTDINGYNIYKDDVLVTFQEELTYEFTGLEADTFYNIKIEPIGTDGEPGLIAEETLKTLADSIEPTDITNLVSSNITFDSFDASWTASTDGFAVVGYDVYLDNVLHSTVVETTVSITGLSVSTTYNIGIEAKDLAGNVSNRVSIDIDTLSDIDNPSEISNLTSSNIEETTATLGWGAATDNLGVTGYRIYLDGTAIDTTTNLTYDLTNLTVNTTYSVEVEAFDLAGNNSAKVGLSITTISSETLFDQFTVRAEAEGFIVESHDGIINTTE